MQTFYENIFTLNKIDVFIKCNVYYLECGNNTPKKFAGKTIAFLF